MELHQLLAQAEQNWKQGRSVMLAGNVRQIHDFLKLIATVRYPPLTAKDIQEIRDEHSN